VDRSTHDLRVLFLYRDSPLRREALAEPPGAAARYSLIGLDELQAEGTNVHHNLVPARAPSERARRAARVLNRLLERTGGYGGDFASVLACRREIAAADVVFSTVDTVGIPLVLARRARLVARTPVVYVSVGLLDRIARLRGGRTRRRYLDAVGSVDAVVAYGHAEAEQLRAWLSRLDAPPPVAFVPFGVDTEAFTPRDVVPDADVVSIGADPHRDYEALARLARATPDLSYRAVAAPEQAHILGAIPNLELETALPFATVPDRLARGRVVVLPVRENAYSGATTTLLQALAMARPVVVSRTSAIADGYGLVDGEHCRLVPPSDDDALAGAVAELLDDPAGASAMGMRGRSHVVRHLGWERFTSLIRTALLRAAGARDADAV
jgi:glycosyltransferase involved in cell wall biosynthesis